MRATPRPPLLRTPVLAEALGVGGGPRPAPLFEDPAEFMLRERKLAPNLDPIDNKLDDPEERRRMALVFDRGLETPRGYVLPIQAWQAPAVSSAEMRALARRRRFRWKSERWRTRRGRLFLIPGDSPAGFRLPLRSLAWAPDQDLPTQEPLDPLARRGPLPARPLTLQIRGVEAAARRLAAETNVGFDPQAAASVIRLSEQDPELQPLYEDIDWMPMEDVAPGQAYRGIRSDDGLFVGGPPVVRTAIAVEPRGGALCVFLPPVRSADEYVDLINAVEETAAALGQPVHVEGYEPPADHRLNVIKVTPDPGVVEVNIHPTATWDEQVAVTETLYEEARLIGLDSSKFLVDGRPTGSGGGAHVVVGGATPEDSPFLRRPDLLASLIRFWQNHPSLSYLFSGMFIGPTSQAPRVDEARHDTLYELEIALDQIPSANGASGAECPPWLLDRLLRDLLTDASGNTHRAEICVDKLFSPDGPAGRLGLVEFRAFEMPPHPRMNLAQMLLLRGLIALFLKRPYHGAFKRFGTNLHDRFLLPDHLWADFLEVIDTLNAGLGLRFEPSWYDAQFEFRFPRYGAISHAGVELELRAALEPWHVLGEDGVSGGSARFVDSSVERLQVRVQGDEGDRYQASVNGFRLPLGPSPRRDGKLCGVRFRTWLPARCLHPTIMPHAPLSFNIVDTWNDRAMASCIYRVAHPGGRNFERQPVNALEAEGRRLARFEAFGDMPGPFRVDQPRVSPDAPHTLDLRRQ